MMRQTRGPALALALSTLFSSAAAGQSIALRALPSAEPAPPLAAVYRVVLQSAWPQLQATAGCENGGTETVQGVLSRTPGGDYTGTFTRHTRLLFCGAHGPRAGACTLVLQGEGQVAMQGTIVDGNQVRLVWTPTAGHAAEVRGACDATFKEGLERMYLTAAHGVEFRLPAAGAGPRRESLEGYAWVVAVE